MTVETTLLGEPITKSGPYNGDGVTAVFDYDFQIQDEVELLVTRQNADLTETVLTLTTDYTVSGVGVDSGGQITLVDPATDAASGTKLVIQYDGMFQQSTDYSNQGRIQLSLLEAALDKLTMHLRGLKEISDRAVTVDAFGVVDITTLRTNISALALIESDITSVAANISSITSVAGVSADIAAVAAITANVTSVAAIAADVTTAAANIAAIVAAPDEASAAAASAIAAAASETAAAASETAAAASAAAALVSEDAAAASAAAAAADAAIIDPDAYILKTGDTLTGAYVATATALGTPVAASTETIAASGSNFQTLTNNAAFTLAAPASGDFTTLIHMTNGASAGVVTLSGFTLVTGDDLTTTNADAFLLFCSRLNSAIHLQIVALQ